MRDNGWERGWTSWIGVMRIHNDYWPLHCDRHSGCSSIYSTWETQGGERVRTCLQACGRRLVGIKEAFQRLVRDCIMPLLTRSRFRSSGWKILRDYESPITFIRITQCNTHMLAFPLQRCCFIRYSQMWIGCRILRLFLKISF